MFVLWLKTCKVSQIVKIQDLTGLLHDIKFPTVFNDVNDLVCSGLITTCQVNQLVNTNLEAPEGRNLCRISVQLNIPERRRCDTFAEVAQLRSSVYPVEFADRRSAAYSTGRHQQFAKSKSVYPLSLPDLGRLNVKETYAIALLNFYAGSASM